MKTYLKYLLITLFPFAYIVSKEKLRRKGKLNGNKNKKALLTGIISFAIFIICWGNIFSDKTKVNNLKTELYNSNDRVFELSRTLELMNTEKYNLEKELKEAKKYGKLTDSQKAELKEKKETAKKKKEYETWIENLFSLWDGSNKKLKEMTINRLKDPDSFKHRETIYYEDKDMKHIIIIMRFTAKNDFGGVVTNTAKCKMLRNGEIEDFEIIY